MQGECPSIVVIDIGNAKRWQCVCQLTRVRHAELIALLDDIIHHDQDHVMPIDIGDADQAAPRVVSLGKTYGLFFSLTPRERSSDAATAGERSQRIAL